MEKPVVGIVMGSDSDLPVMSKAAAILEEFGVPYEMRVISAHREPDVFFEYAKGAEARGLKVIIAGAGMAAHLPGMCAALFPLPVIGVPMHTTSLGGRDSLYSIVQMPSGIPVATVAIVVALVIPIAKLGRKLAEACKARPGTIKFNLINGFPFTVINSCLLGTIMSGLGIFQARRQMPMEVLIKQPPFVKVWLGSCLENLPIAIIVSYILAIIISPIVVKMVGPGGPPPENRKPEN